MAKACRTCTQAITSHEYFFLNGSSYISSGLQIKHLLQSCIPEIDVELLPNSALCRNCLSALHIAYCFKEETIRNEETLRMKQHVRIKNLDVLTKIALGEQEATVDLTNAKKNEKGEAFEVELADINELKVEFVYDEDADVANDVEIVNADEEHIVTDAVGEKNEQDDEIKSTECLSAVPYDEGFQLLDNLACDDNFLVSDEPFEEETKDVLQPGDSCEVGDNFLGLDVKEEIEKGTVDAGNILTYIQKTSFSSRKMRNVNRPYKCNECNFRSDARASLAMHKRIHTGEKPFHCTECSYKAKRKAHLEDHMKIHTGERPYQCPSCSKCFITKQIMKKHARIHTGEKPYQCMECNYKFRHKLSVENHVKKVHMGVNQFPEQEQSICYICGKCLSGPASLSTHMRIHTGVKSHLCELCGRYFREKGMLKNHMRTHTGEKPFKCSECDYIATRKAHLQDHMRTHVGRLELVECPDCGKRYATKLLLKKHMKEQHKS